MKALFAFVALAGLSTGALAQQTASLGPADFTPLVDQCKIVASNQHSGDNSTDGVCVSKTQAFLVALIATKPTNEVLDQTIADLVVQLANLAQSDTGCNAFDDEIAAAIKLASSYSKDPDQVTQLVEISATVGACEDNSTAALPIEGLTASKS